MKPFTINPSTDILYEAPGQQYSLIIAVPNVCEFEKTHSNPTEIKENTELTDNLRQYIFTKKKKKSQAQIR